MAVELSSRDRGDLFVLLSLYNLISSKQGGPMALVLMEVLLNLQTSSFLAPNLKLALVKSFKLSLLLS